MAMARDRPKAWSCGRLVLRVEKPPGSGMQRQGISAGQHRKKTTAVPYPSPMAFAVAPIRAKKTTAVSWGRMPHGTLRLVLESGRAMLVWRGKP